MDTSVFWSQGAYILTGFVLIGIALAKWKKYPRTSLMIVAALTVLVTSRLSITLFHYWLLDVGAFPNPEGWQSWVLQGIFIVFSFISFSAYAALFWTVFANRHGAGS
jgi:hypothetical protein